jgi:hypothetical protein
MARNSSQAGRLSETLWSVLMLICVGLVVLHLANAVRAQRAPDETLIQRTFTPADANAEP